MSDSRLFRHLFRKGFGSSWVETYCSLNTLMVPDCPMVSIAASDFHTGCRNCRNYTIQSLIMRLRRTSNINHFPNLHVTPDPHNFEQGEILIDIIVSQSVPIAHELVLSIDTIQEEDIIFPEKL